MRYLKVIAQDRSYSGRPDTVVLQFCATVAGSKEAVINNAYALDINEDGDIDVCLGDVTNNELESTRDHQLLSKFAGAYLKFNWFSSGLASMRYMHIFTEDFYKDGTPDTVRLHLYKGFGPITKKTQVMWSAAYDFDNDGALEWNIHFDVNHDGVIDDIDRTLVQQLAETYLRFKWHEPEGAPRCNGR